MEPVLFLEGETFLHVSGGGGGHGDPLDRAPRDVLEDIREERFTIDYARDIYGGIINEDHLELDYEATKRRRDELRKKGADAERPSYLRYFHNALGIKNFRLVGEREMER